MKYISFIKEIKMNKIIAGEVSGVIIVALCTLATFSLGLLMEVYFIDNMVSTPEGVVMGFTH
jgi:hypothetical protein